MRLFKLLLQNIYTRRPYGNWDSINAFILRRSRFKNLHILPSAHIFFLSFFYCIRIYSSNFMSINNDAKKFSFLPFPYLTLANICPHQFMLITFNQIKVSDICHHLVSYNYFQKSQLPALNHVLIFE